MIDCNKTLRGLVAAQLLSRLAPDIREDVETILTSYRPVMAMCGAAFARGGHVYIPAGEANLPAYLGAVYLAATQRQDMHTMVLVEDVADRLGAELPAHLAQEGGQ